MTQDQQDGQQGGPFDGGPFDPAAEKGGSSFLDDLRASGEEVVSDEIAGMQAAMQRVESFTEAVGGADISELKSEWQEIEAEIRRALQTGLAVAEQSRARAHATVVAEEVRALEAELARKNDLINQLTGSVRGLDRQLDEREKAHRDEVREARDRAAVLEEEVGPLRMKLGDLENQLAKLSTEVDSATEERDGLRRKASELDAALRSERSLQEERHEALAKELDEERLLRSRLENEKRAVERRTEELGKRLEAAEAARARLEVERDEQAQDAARSAKEARSLGERVASLQADLKAQKDRVDRDLAALRRSEGRLRAHSDTLRDRASKAATALRAALATIGDLPDVPAADEGAASPPSGAAEPEA